MPAQGETRRLFIKTYGCQMNVYDSERMADVLRPLGYAMTDAPEAADFVILNTCHIRERAAEKVYSELGKIKQMREAKAARGEGGMTIAVAGCVAQAEGEEIMEEYKDNPALDAGLLAAAQAVEHYEITRYGTLKRWANVLGLKDAAKLIDQTLEEESQTDVDLTAIADAAVNAEAMRPAA